ncbi:MAG TPA: ureidoglycolate lyase [Gaiellales bacterium]|nr:ureidoglycolate lyase [Gaiellales bacterium]
MTRLAVSELTAAAFAPYGQVVAEPCSAEEASGPGWRWWAETAELPPAEPGLGIGYLALEPAPAIFDWAERHMRSPETIVPLGGDCLVYVAPPEQAPALDNFAVFRVRRGQAIVLAPGVWHGAPFATDGPMAALVLLRTGTGREDTTVVRFPDTPVEIDDADR